MEQAVGGDSDDDAVAAAVAELEAASLEVREAIGARFGDHNKSADADTFGDRSRDH